MSLPAFKLEDYFAKYEFAVEYNMGASDCETHTLTELISMADEECLLLWQDLKLCYTETRGLPLLRDEISKLYAIQSPDNIVLFSGAEEAIYITMQVMLKKGDHVVALTPCYQSLNQVAKSIGANVTDVSLDWENGCWNLNLEKFAAAVTDDTKLIIINFPHNPTGFLPSRATFKKIIDVAKQRGCYLFSDEVYRLSEHHPDYCLPSAADCYDKALSLGVMSKSFGLPGLRIGWLATHDRELLSHITAYKNYTTICNSAPSEILSLIALRNKEKILQRNVAIARNNLDLLDEFFARHKNMFEWYRPNAGFINFPRLTMNMSIDKFTDKLLHQAGIIILPGSLFDNSTNHFRIGFGRSNLPEALLRLECFIENNSLNNAIHKQNREC